MNNNWSCFNLVFIQESGIFYWLGIEYPSHTNQYCARGSEGLCISGSPFVQQICIFMQQSSYNKWYPKVPMPTIILSKMKRGRGVFAMVLADTSNETYNDSTINWFACRSCGRYMYMLNLYTRHFIWGGILSMQTISRCITNANWFTKLCKKCKISYATTMVY